MATPHDLNHSNSDIIAQNLKTAEEMKTVFPHLEEPERYKTKKIC